MATERVGLMVGLSLQGRQGRTARHSKGGTREVRTTVFALVPEFELVYVRDEAGAQYALTPKTPGVELKALHEGQVLVCTVTSRLPRVLSAQALGW